MNNYWFQDINNLIDINKYNKLLPYKDDTYIEKVNILVRISILVGIILSIINLNLKYLVIPILVMLGSYLVYYYNNEKYKNIEKQYQDYYNKLNKNKSKFTNIEEPDKSVIPDNVLKEFEKYVSINKCQYPSKNNAFMNALPFDDRKRYEACNYTNNKDVKADVEHLFGYHPTDTADIFKKTIPRLTFYTMPNTTFPNNRDNFAEWVFARDISCKEGNGEQCYNNMYHGLNNRLGGHEYL